ncbi:hemagglutinin [Mycoplasmopsis synoviae]|uniref:hemagglutinin n=1 Tax=Mycoplasmopsis synoviae TaxID=2109 RepID=UPI001CE0836A|nr:hemagglutinin [Mycoplasmopsis synoviae]UBX99378.1 hemagglutinin [Mycoplasmopsis synoviae]UBY00318.1 hemagglutinin [Mycoplasmopsis synoviae]
MPKIVNPALPEEVAPRNREYNESPNGGYPFWKERNALILTTWFNQNQDKLSLVADQLTKKLGEEKFKNMTLSNPRITWDELVRTEGTILTPKVTFNLAAKDGYTLAEGSATTVTLTIRVLYKDSNPTRNVLSTQGASYSSAPRGATVNDANVKAKVNVYMNYTGPSIVLDEAHPTVGATPNTSINGTSNVDGDFNTKFKNLLVNVVGGSFTQTSLLQAIINYVNKFDPKFRAAFVLNTNGVAITKVENTKELRPGTLDDLLSNKDIVFLQQIKGDTKAVYFAVTAIASNNWLNTFLIRIPLTKFVRPLTAFTATPASAPTQTDSGTGAQTQPEAQS